MAPGPHTWEAAWQTGPLGATQLPQGASALPTAEKEGDCGARAHRMPRPLREEAGSPGGVRPRPFPKYRLPSALEASPSTEVIQPRTQRERETCRLPVALAPSAPERNAGHEGSVLNGSPGNEE